MSRDMRITPSILNAKRDDLRNEIARIASVSDLLHLDVMDDLFVPNFTFDFEASSKIIEECPIPVDAHLMVADVDTVAAAYAEVGAASVTIHVEACEDIRHTLRAIRSGGARAAIAVKPQTEIDRYADFFDEVDMVLIMTVEPGFGGQKFIPDVLKKIERLKERMRNRLRSSDGWSVLASYHTKPTSTRMPKSMPRQELSSVRGRTSSSHIRMMSASGNWNVSPVSRLIIVTNE